MRRSGLSILETLVVLFILAALLALLLPAVLQVRESALRSWSQNNKRQIILATLHFANAHQDRLPSIDGAVGTANHPMSLWTALLPYVEQGAWLQTTQNQPPGTSGGPDPCRVFRSPMDWTLNLPGIATGAISYAASGQLFVKRPRLPASIPDGQSNTIAFAEHYANCRLSTQFIYSTGDGLDSFFRRATFADAGVPGFVGTTSDAYPVVRGNPPRAASSWPHLPPFQAAPDLFECDSRVAQTPHRSGMICAFADGSVRVVAATVDPAVYWGSVTPAGGEVIAWD